MTFAFLVGGSALAAPRVIPILHGGHFDDLVKDCRPEHREACPPVLLAFFSNQCASTFEALRYSDWGMPERSQLLMGKYNMSATTDVWWDHTPETDLAARFNIGEGDCPKLMFAPHDDWGKATFWGTGTEAGAALDWKSWVMQQLEVNLVVKNDNGGPISIMLDRRVSEDTHILEPGEARDFKLKAGYSIAAVEPQEDEVIWSDQAHYAYNHGKPFIVHALSPGGLHPEEGAGVLNMQSVDDRELLSRDQDTTFRHASVLKQTPHLPGHSPLGYKLVDMPKDVTDLIVGWYDQHKTREQVEGFYPGYTTINFKEIPTTMVSLDQDPHTKKTIADALMPIVEEWAGEQLHMTALYGIREYHKGSWLKLHVDHVSTHVYSVIINVAQEWEEGREPESGGEDWPVQVIDFLGHHANVTMRPGQMLLYESAKLVHGRPSKLQGRKYVNCFAHYKPIDDTKWDFYHQNDILTSRSLGELADLKVY